MTLRVRAGMAWAAWLFAAALLIAALFAPVRATAPPPQGAASPFTSELPEPGTVHGDAAGKDDFFFKRRGLVPSVLGPMELVRASGFLPTWSVAGQVGTMYGLTLPTIWLPRDITDPTVLGTLQVNQSTVVALYTPTKTCKYNYILLTINRDRKYFARRLEPCDHALTFSADDHGVLVTEAGVADPQLWWMSDSSFTGPVTQSTLYAAPTAPVETARTETPPAPGTAEPPASTKASGPAKSRAVPPRKVAVAAKRPAGRTVAGKARPVEITRANTVRHLEAAAHIAVMFKMPTDRRHPAPICLADSATCGT